VPTAPPFTCRDRGHFAAAANVDAVSFDGIARKWAGRLTDTDYWRSSAPAENSRERLLLQYGTSLAEVRAGTTYLIPKRTARSATPSARE